MGRHTDLLPSLSRTSGAGVSARPLHRAPSLPAFSFWVSLAIVLVSVIAPEPAHAETRQVTAPVETQNMVLVATQAQTLVRDGYRVTKRPVAPAAGTPDPGSSQAIAWELVQARGWDAPQFDCLVALWQKESHWNHFAMNASSGAYGIPQALPGTKMASAGDDWATNPRTQIVWGLGYIAGRYATPCGAWEHSQAKNWY